MKQIFKKIIVLLLECEAKLVLKKYKPEIIAITGSVGKTSTKDVIYTVLSKSAYVRKSEKSFNSEIGIPLTILGLSNAWDNPIEWFKNLIEGVALIILAGHYPKTLVLEVGADRPGDIERVAPWLSPSSVVLTHFPSVPVHVEFFESPKHVIKEKLNLVKVMKSGGTLIVNFDDENTRSIKPPDGVSVLSYGLSKGATLTASNKTFTYDKGKVSGVTFRVNYGGVSVPIMLKGVLGDQHIYPVLAAIALGVSKDLNIVDIGEALKEHSVSPGRMNLIQGINDSIIIDDSYNSSPIAVEKALDALSEVKAHGRKIAVLGDMMELGAYSVPAHKEVGRKVAEILDVLVVVGIRSHYIAEEARKKKMKKKNIFIFNNSEEAGEFLKGELSSGDVVLVKGSQSIRMERVVESVMKEPEKKKELLVRQEEQWLKK